MNEVDHTPLDSALPKRYPVALGLLLAPVPIGGYWLRTFTFAQALPLPEKVAEASWFLLFLTPTIIGFFGAVILIEWIRPRHRQSAMVFAVLYSFLLFYAYHKIETGLLRSSFPINPDSPVSFWESFRLRANLNLVVTDGTSREGRVQPHGVAMFHWIAVWCIDGLVLGVGGLILCSMGKPIQGTDPPVRPKMQLPRVQRGSPLRSKPLGFVLGILGIFLISGSFIAYGYLSDSGKTALEFLAIPAYLLLFIPSMISFWLAGHVWRTDARKVLAASDASVILYLRTFGEEASESPTGASWGGTRSPVFQGSIAHVVLLVGMPVLCLGAGALSDRYPWAMWIPKILLGAAAIAFLGWAILSGLSRLRSLLGSDISTIEDELTAFFRMYGQFIAIGQPNERFAPRGAARLYVLDEQWKATVLELLQRSRLVVLQLGLTPGTWWEVETCLKQISHNKLLLLVAGPMLSAECYDAFRLRFAATSGIDLPPAIEAMSFIVFDANWTPAVLPIRTRSWLLQPIFASSLDLAGTLRDIVNRNRTAQT